MGIYTYVTIHSTLNAKEVVNFENKHLGEDFYNCLDEFFKLTNKYYSKEAFINSNSVLPRTKGNVEERWFKYQELYSFSFENIGIYFDIAPNYISISCNLHWEDFLISKKERICFINLCRSVAKSLSKNKMVITSEPNAPMYIIDEIKKINSKSDFNNYLNILNNKLEKPIPAKITDIELSDKDILDPRSRFVESYSNLIDERILDYYWIDEF